MSILVSPEDLCESNSIIRAFEDKVVCVGFLTNIGGQIVLDLVEDGNIACLELNCDEAVSAPVFVIGGEIAILHFSLSNVAA